MSKKTVFQTEWFSVEEERFDHIAALEGKPYYRICSPDGVLILALTENQEIILVKQFRPVLHQYTLEFPSGMIENAEIPQETATRELYEETGYVCKTLHQLGSGRIMMNRNTSREYLFLGVDAVQSTNFVCQENIEVLLVKPVELREMVLSGQIEQLAALSLLALADWLFNTQFIHPTGEATLPADQKRRGNV